ncbi:DNA mismatch repair endonuclease MutL [candidate division KSB1 bacterium]|nr:DNA mismatch repair endonuclease MutL [candidate division KSB1 bacterium]
MPNKIQILSEDLTNKIAAGEVVERPASVVKELIENAIDAGSDEISIIVREGGKGLIQVVDNGTGMSRDDAILSLQRHTTSKIATYDDLHNIHTLGFRGEALASIASVSRLELKTMQHDAAEGTMIKVDSGVIEDVVSAGGVRGTSISIKNLFFNTPARRKFLKRDETEYRYILNFINRFTLAYPQIRFTLYNNDQKIFELAPAELDERIIQVLGKRYQGNLVEINSDQGIVAVNGYIGNQDAARKSRGDQYLFLNGRYIANRALNHAIVAAYGTIIPRGEFPLYTAFIEIDPRRVDVNVHPSKIEVKFADERLVYDILRRSVRAALDSQHMIPSITPFAPQPLVQPLRGIGQQTQIPLDEFQRSSPEQYERLVPFYQGEQRQEVHQHQPSVLHQQLPRQPIAEGTQPIHNRVHVWQIHNQYIMSEIKSGVVIIDQHVAHERILYEKALKSFELNKPASQQLLFPQVVDLTPEEMSLVKDVLPFLEKIGFMIKGFGGNTVVIEGVPSGMKVRSPEKILNEILDDYKKNKSDSLDIRDNVAKSYSCKMAVKAGDKLTLEEMNSLIDQLFATQSPYFCPHGRPVIINISIEELDKRFGRI